MDDFYAARKAAADAVFLLIEVAKSSMQFDKTVKLALYARFGIPGYWVVNLDSRELEAYRLVDGQFGDPGKHGAGEILALAAAPDISITSDRLFG